MTEEYKRKLDDALVYQDFVKHQMYRRGVPLVFNDSREFQFTEGENIFGIEVKNDKRFRNTGNLYIETAEKSDPKNPHFVASGIYRNDNSWLYLIGDYKTIYIFGINILTWLHRTKKYEEREIDTSQGYLLPVTDGEKYAVKIISVKETA